MCPMAHRDLLKMNFTEYNVFSEIPHNENDNDNVLSENIIYIGAGIGFVFASCVLFVRIIFKPKDKDEKITEVTI